LVDRSIFCRIRRRRKDEIAIASPSHSSSSAELAHVNTNIHIHIHIPRAAHQADQETGTTTGVPATHTFLSPLTPVRSLRQASRSLGVEGAGKGDVDHPWRSSTKPESSAVNGESGGGEDDGKGAPLPRQTRRSRRETASKKQ